MIIDKELKIAGDDHKGFQREYYPRSGHIAVMLGFITLEQLKEAISEQIDDDLAYRHHRSICEILFAKEWITREQIDIILDELYNEEMRIKGKL